MMMTVPITEFRKNLFKYADLVALEGYEVEVEKKGNKVFKITGVKDDDVKVRAEKALELAKKMVGKIKFNKRLFRNKREIDYMKHLGENW